MKRAITITATALLTTPPSNTPAPYSSPSHSSSDTPNSTTSACAMWRCLRALGSRPGHWSA